MIASNAALCVCVYGYVRGGKFDWARNKIEIKLPKKSQTGITSYTYLCSQNTFYCLAHSNELYIVLIFSLSVIIFFRIVLLARLLSEIL